VVLRLPLANVPWRRNLVFFNPAFVNTNPETQKTKSPREPGFLARGLWNFFVYGGSKSAVASGQKCVVCNSDSNRSNNTRSGGSFALRKKVTLHGS
jgi:hypothetical protein